MVVDARKWLQGDDAARLMDSRAADPRTTQPASARTRASSSSTRIPRQGARPPVLGQRARIAASREAAEHRTRRWGMRQTGRTPFVLRTPCLLDVCRRDGGGGRELGLEYARCQRTNGSGVPRPTLPPLDERSISESRPGEGSGKGTGTHRPLARSAEGLSRRGHPPGSAPRWTGCRAFMSVGMWAMEFNLRMVR